VGGTPDQPFLKNNPQFLGAFRDVVARASRSTVRVRCEGADVALGTVVGADGWVLTKASELAAEVVCRLRDGREFNARLVGTHEAHDLATPQDRGTGLTPVDWRPSKDDAVGHWVASRRPGAPNPWRWG